MQDSAIWQIYGSPALMSAVGPKADISECLRNIRYSPESGHSPTRSGCLLWARSKLMHRSKKHLFDHLVGAAEQWQRHCDAERVGGLEVDGELDLG